jgi:hypothetical protein
VAEIILHQYVNSPFSEKIRKLFAFKKISWRSVEQPVIMPKPALIPPTGGYLRVPVMADDYGFDPVAGAVVASSIYEIAIRRNEPQLGELVVHFPKVGFRIAQA